MTPTTPVPRAVSHFGLAAMEARAAGSRRVVAPVPPARPLAPAWPERPQRRTVVRLWLPMTPIFLLLSPFAILLSPLMYLAPPPYGYRPLATVLGIGALLMSLGGT